MNDTPKYIQQKQFEIIRSIPLSDRINGLFEMTELSRKIIENRLKVKNPGISYIELKLEMFKTYYCSDFDPETLNKILQSMKQYWEKNLTDADL